MTHVRQSALPATIVQRRRVGSQRAIELPRRAPRVRRWRPRTTPQGLLPLVLFGLLLFLPVVAQADADLAIAKADATDPVQVSQVLVYTLTVENTGPDPATDVRVDDSLPANVTYVDAGASQGTCFLAPGDVVECDLGTVANGATATIDIEVVPTQAGTITNTATVTASTPDPNALNDTASENTVVVAADFRALKRVVRTVQDPVVRYEVELINDGNLDQPDNPGPEFIDVIPDETEIVPHTLQASSGTIAYEAVNHRIVWNGVIPANDRVTLEFAVGTGTGLVVASSVDERQAVALPLIGLAMLGTAALATRKRRQLGVVAILIVVSIGAMGCSGFWTAPTSVDSPTSLCNQGELRFDSDANGTNDAVQLTDDPDTTASPDPTCVIFIP